MTEVTATPEGFVVEADLIGRTFEIEPASVPEGMRATTSALPRSQREVGPG